MEELIPLGINNVFFMHRHYPLKEFILFSTMQGLMYLYITLRFRPHFRGLISQI